MTTTVHADKGEMVAYALYATILVAGLIPDSIGPTLDALADQNGSTPARTAAL